MKKTRGEPVTKGAGQLFDRVAVVLPVLLLLATPCLAAESYCVAPTGADSNPGSEAKPWKTIQKAADTMSPGDTVTVLAGNYATERVGVTKSGTAESPIAYQAKGTVVMKGFKITANYITVRGFEIADTDYVRWHADVSAGVYVKGHHVTVENNYVHDATLNGIVLFGTPEEPAVTSNCTVRNNRLFRNEMAGISVSGRNNLIEGNEVWGTMQYHPKVLAAEGHPAKIGGLDADGMRFFGQGHIFRKNRIHDIKFGAPGINPEKGDYNDNPHTDCFQTWSGKNNEAAKDIVFEQNICDLADAQTPNETTQGFMIEGEAENIVIRNNVFKTFRGVNAIGSKKLIVVNNTFVSDLSLNPKFHPGGVGLKDCPDSIIKNNIFYDMPGHAINVSFTGTEPSPKTALDYVVRNMTFRSDGKSVWEPYTYSHGHDLWNVDPKLADPAKGDYHLKPDSPAIAAGAEVSDVKVNLDGVARPQGKPCAIGAFEYHPPEEKKAPPKEEAPADRPPAAER
jgi:parallel beta-helix repeat protein